LGYTASPTEMTCIYNVISWCLRKPKDLAENAHIGRRLLLAGVVSGIW